MQQLSKLLFYPGDRTHSSTTAIALFLRFSARRSPTMPSPTMPSYNQRSQHTKKTQTMSVSNTSIDNAGKDGNRASFVKKNDAPPRIAVAI
ncbi:MAG: hypothetical protein KME50_28630 [Nostoc desertorum CM1-VF14]|nr:hypothetical protein [Nostoc desertorum CM1-VF14]